MEKLLLIDGNSMLFLAYYAMLWTYDDNEQWDSNCSLVYHHK